MTLAIENVANQSANGSSSGSITVNTSGTNRIVVLMIMLESNNGSTAPKVTNVTSTHVTWVQKYQTQNNVASDFSGKITQEVWVGFAATQLSSESVSLTFDSTTDGAEINYLAISGATETSAPFLDPNSSIPTVNVGNPASSTISTTNNDNVLITFGATGSRSGSINAPSGFTQQQSYDDHGPGSWDICIGIATKIVSSPQSSIAVSMGTSAGQFSQVTFAVSGDVTSTGVTGTWASAEGTDTMSAAGLGPTTPPFIDATFGEHNDHGFSLTSPASFSSTGVTNKTAGGNELVVAAIAYNWRSGSGVVTSVTVSGLTFAFVGKVINTTAGQEDTTIEVWAAEASSAFNPSGASLTYTIDWTTGGEIDNVALSLFAVEGLYNIAAPYDQNLSLPASAFNTTNTTAPAVTYSTTQAHDLLIFLSANAAPFAGNTQPVAPSGWTQIALENENNGLAGVTLGVNTKAVSATQTGATVQDAATGNQTSWTGLVLALTADEPPPPTGTWASTEADDTFSAHGGLLGGSWHSMEAKDIFDFERFNGPHGPWGSTEHADTMAFGGTSNSGTTYDHSTASAGVDFQNNNLTITNTAAFGTPVGARSTTRRTTGKLYAEFNTLLFNNQSGVGIGTAATTFTGFGGTEGSSPGPAQDGAGIFQNQNGTIWVDQVEQNNWAGISLNNALVGVAIDLDNNLIWFQTNGGHWNGTPVANPATGAGGWDISGIVTGPVYLYTVVFGQDDQVTMNAGASAFTYSIPSGFTAWDSSIPPANPLQLDGYATGGASSPSFTPLTSANVTLSTTKNDDVIVLSIATGGFFSASQVTTVTDTAGLTWKRRNRRWQNGGNMSNEASNFRPGNINQGLDIEIWWAHAPTALSGDIITVNTSNGTGAISIIAFGVAGANFTTPWDTHSQAGGYIDNLGNNAFSPAMAELSTNAANCFLFGIHMDNINADSGVAQQPWTYVTSVVNFEHDGDSLFESFAYQLAEEPQISTNVLFGVPFGGGVVYTAATVMFDSIVAAGETGTAEEIVWFWDAASVNNVLQLSTGTTLTLNYNAINWNLMVIVEVMIQSASGLGEVTSISESQGITSSAGFERRSRVVTGTPQGTIATEIWWAWFPGLTERANDDTLTINTSGTAAGDFISAQAWGLGGSTGAYGLGDPFWDINPSLPAENSSNSDSPSPNATDITTTIPTTILVAWTANNSVPVPGFTDPYITLLQAFPNTVQPVMQLNSNAPNFYMGFEYLFTPTRVSDETAEFLTSPEPSGWIVIADAIPVGPPVPPVGEWLSTEHTDTFSAHGFVPVLAAWHSTDHADEFTGAPAFAPYFGEGWMAAVPAHAIWASNERADQMDLYGWIVGFGCVGQLHAFEDKDRLAFSNRTTVTGVWQSTERKDRLASAGLVLPLRGTPPQIVKRRLLIIT